MILILKNLRTYEKVGILLDSTRYPPNNLVKSTLTLLHFTTGRGERVYPYIEASYILVFLAPPRNFIANHAPVARWPVLQ